MEILPVEMFIYSKNIFEIYHISCVIYSELPL